VHTDDICHILVSDAYIRGKKWWAGCDDERAVAADVSSYRRQLVEKVENHFGSATMGWTCLRCCYSPVVEGSVPYGRKIPDSYSLCSD